MAQRGALNWTRSNRSKFLCLLNLMSQTSGGSTERCPSSTTSFLTEFLKGGSWTEPSSSMWWTLSSQTSWSRSSITHSRWGTLLKQILRRRRPSFWLKIGGRCWWKLLSNQRRTARLCSSWRRSQSLLHLNANGRFTRPSCLTSNQLRSRHFLLTRVKASKLRPSRRLLQKWTHSAHRMWSWRRSELVWVTYINSVKLNLWVKQSQTSFDDVLTLLSCHLRERLVDEDTGVGAQTFDNILSFHTSKETLSFWKDRLNRISI